MKASLVAALPLDAQQHISRPQAARKIWVLSICAGLSLFFGNVFCREFYSGDEGFYGVTALNMLHSPNYLIRPSYFPEGDFTVEKDAFAHPPFNSYFYALSLWLTQGSRIGPELVNLLAFLALLYFSYRTIAAFDSTAAKFAVLLLAASPSIRVSYSQLEAEPLMTTFGVAALYCSLRLGPAPGRGRWLFLAGLCLGFAYALKLWLCGPLALAVAAALVIRLRQWDAPLRAKVPALALFGVGAVIPAGGHLLAIALTHPEDLRFWIKNIYFGVFASAGISGSKVGGGGVTSDWVHPVWYYGPALYRDHFFLLPILLAGWRSAWLEFRAKRDWLWILGAGLFGLVPLSLISVKEPLYVLACVVFAYFLAGSCLAALARRLAAGAGIDSASFRVASLVTLGSLIVFPLAYLRGIQAGKITLGFVIGHSLFCIAFLAILLWARRKSDATAFEWSVFGACALTILAIFGFDVDTKRPRDKTIASVLQPYLNGNAPAALSIVASNFKSYQFYCFHRGCYWHELPLKDGPQALLTRPAYNRIRAFIMDADDLARPEVRPWLNWLEGHAVEKTGELDARLHRPSGVRVFVSPKD